MKKPQRFILIFVIAFAATFGISYYIDHKDYYEPGENGAYTLNAGNTFAIKLNENGSTGSANCWLDTTPSGLKLIAEKYEPGPGSTKGCEGCGGITTYTFKALKKGSYTLNVANCPLAYDGKECSYYTTQNTKPDNVFTITVTE